MTRDVFMMWIHHLLIGQTWANNLTFLFLLSPLINVGNIYVTIKFQSCWEKIRCYLRKFLGDINSRESTTNLAAGWQTLSSDIRREELFFAVYSGFFSSYFLKRLKHSCLYPDRSVPQTTRTHSVGVIPHARFVSTGDGKCWPFFPEALSAAVKLKPRKWRQAGRGLACLRTHSGHSLSSRLSPFRLINGMPYKQQKFWRLERKHHGSSRFKQSLMRAHVLLGSHKTHKWGYSLIPTHGISHSLPSGPTFQYHHLEGQGIMTWIWGDTNIQTTAPPKHKRNHWDD